MCGRFTQRHQTFEVATIFGASSEGVQIPQSYNIAPTQGVAMVRPGETGDGRELLTARWGLLPSWVGDPKDFPTLINARSETAAEKPSFRSAFRRRRCLIPADGFYEWQERGEASKQPYFLHIPGEKLFGFAGLWEHWEREGETPVTSCTILTTEANDIVKPVHKRMPVMVGPDDFRAWLDTDGPDEELERLLRSPASEKLEAYPVSRKVNSPANDNSELVERVDAP